MTPIVVVLNDDEQRVAEWNAKRRQARNNAAGVAEQKISGRTAADINKIGVGAELAVCKLFNLYFDLDTHPRRGSADCERFGETIDVKTTEYPRGKLLAAVHKREFAADCYALMVADWPSFRFAGFMRGDELLKSDRLTDLGYGPTYAAPQEMLTADQIRFG